MTKTAADALVEVASQMKALEARVSALSPSQHSSPSSVSAAASISAKHDATKPAAVTNDSGDVVNSVRAGPAASLTSNKVVGVALADSIQTGQHSSEDAADAIKSDRAVHGRGRISAAEGRAVAGTGAAGQQVASTADPNAAGQGRAAGNIPVPDLMTFSPAVGRPPAAGSGHQQAAVTSHPVSLLQPTQQATPPASGLLRNAQSIASQPQQGLQLGPSRQDLTSAQKQEDAACLQQFLPAQHSPGLQQPKQQADVPLLHQLESHDGAVRAGLQGHWLPDSRPGSPLPASNFYDNAVFGSPTPTPSPQGGVLDPSRSLLSPGSSPRPQQHVAGAHLSRAAGKLAFAKALCLLSRRLMLQQDVLMQCKAQDSLALRCAAQNCWTHADRSQLWGGC